MATGNRSRSESLRGWPLALVLTCACAVDNAGIGGGSGAAGSAGGGPNAAGAGGGGGPVPNAGVGGASPAGTGGAAADGGHGGAGGGGGDAGTGGTGSDAGTGGGGDAGTGGTGGDAGSNGDGAAAGGGDGAAAGGDGDGARGGTGGAGGEGAAGAAGSGAAGATGGAGAAAGNAGHAGRGGAGGAGRGCDACPACTRCTNGACTVDPASLWKVRCISASIAQTKPGGGAWDPGPGSGSAPDPQCAFWLGNAVAAETSVLMDTYAPAWNESITPGSRFAASLLSSQSNPWSIRVTDDDPPAGAETICSVSPALDAAAFLSGTATFVAASCTSLQIGIECVSP